MIRVQLQTIDMNSNNVHIDGRHRGLCVITKLMKYSNLINILLLLLTRTYECLLLQIKYLLFTGFILSI